MLSNLTTTARQGLTWWFFPCSASSYQASCFSVPQVPRDHVGPDWCLLLRVQMQAHSHRKQQWVRSPDLGASQRTRSCYLPVKEPSIVSRWTENQIANFIFNPIKEKESKTWGFLLSLWGKYWSNWLCHRVLGFGFGLVQMNYLRPWLNSPN